MLANIVLTPRNATPEITFKEYSPHFNFILRTKHTPTYIATLYPELFYNKEKTIPICNSNKEAIKYLSSMLNIPAKYISTIQVPKTLISDEYKVFKPLIYPIIKQDIVIIQRNSKLLDVLPRLKTAKKIITYQDIFVFFAQVHNIQCLAIYNNSDWNPNVYKNLSSITLVPDNTNHLDEYVNVFINK